METDANGGAVGSFGQGTGAVTDTSPQQFTPQNQANQAVGAGFTGRGAQFVYMAATVANILCQNLTQTQINLLANFLSVVTSCVYAVLTVENPNELLE